MRLIAVVIAAPALLAIVPAQGAARPPERAALRTLGVSVTWPVSGSRASVRAGEYLSATETDLTG